ncbi:MAG: pilus assembly protein [Anaerolineae bacterium]|nr:pilus assembly protein [Anaerolineae bacterium]
MMRAWMASNRDRPCGQSLVEVALALPILLMLMLGLLDFGRAYYALVTLSDAASEGAMAAAARQDFDEVERRVRSAESTALVPMDAIAVEMSPGPYAVGSGIVVTTTYELQLLTPFVNGLVGSGELTLRRQATQPVITVSN